MKTTQQPRSPADAASSTPSGIPAGRALGVCVGASTIKAVELLADGTLGRVLCVAHECNPRTRLLDVLREMQAESFEHVAITGRKFRYLLDLPTITETEAVEQALQWLAVPAGGYDALLSLGSETFVLNQLNRQGHVIDVVTGNKCASGTGEFFLQQIRRMNLSLEQAIEQARREEAHRVSGRCSVFCKSDCTHALNKGVRPGEVSAGLCAMMAEKIMELTGKTQARKVILVGGVTRNELVVRHLREQLEQVWIPDQADCFEALGAAVYARVKRVQWSRRLQFNQDHATFHFLPPISQGQSQVSFQTMTRSQAEAGQRCLLGLDVGSTTTKAVVIREQDNALLADVYLRTNGDPVGAARACYRALHEKLAVASLHIIGLGVTGSGRQLAGLHALTDAVINEIIAHATAAVYFDPGVDTIFEIGGQDAKYTHLVNAVPADYAMNEACSAGTGSFLEESAKESLGIEVEQIAEIALRSQKPPNFNDQCAAFISSDIKNASHEDIESSDIIAGLVYSICMNYCNRVKGARPTGRKIFMQGGVCYNRAVPMAMANLIRKPIVVPPEPGLMGAFGVALEVKKRIGQKLLPEAEFDLQTLADREIESGQPFRCRGAGENCDRACLINIYRVAGKNYPFGGICNKYYNQRHNMQVAAADFNWVRRRQELVFDPAAPNRSPETATSVGISRSFSVNTFHPLYHTFFHELGFAVILAEKPEPRGLQNIHSSFCYPAELAHGFMQNLIDQKPDYIFLPAISRLPLEFKTSGKIIRDQCSCVIMGGEPYYLRSAFDLPPQTRLLTPVLDFKKGLEAQSEVFVQIAAAAGVKDAAAARAAYARAVERQREFFRRRRELGRQAMASLEQNPDQTGVVLFGRSYNAFSYFANLGIPNKFASRGIHIIPYDALPFQDEPLDQPMNWASGEELLRAARLAQRHPQLFGVFITNFSCGPDSFMVGYFRDIMQTKPSLTLELDSHSADAGIDTRVEAFLDIVDRYRTLRQDSASQAKAFQPARTVMRNGGVYCETAERELLPLTDRRVRVLFPSMGSYSSRAIAAAFRGYNIQAEAVPVPKLDTLMLGRGQCSCKECLPLLLTTGSLLEYLDSNHRDPNEFLLYFMPTCGGNCRFPQYSVFLEQWIRKRQVSNVALLTLSGENSYGGLGPLKLLNILRGIIAADIMDDVRNTLLVLARNREAALARLEEEWQGLLDSLSRGGKGFYRRLRQAAARLGKIPLRHPLSEAKTVVLAGEIYVRRDEFSCQNLLALLARHDIVVKRAPSLEWLYYIDYMVEQDPETSLTSARQKIEFKAKRWMQRHLERKIKKIMAASKLYQYDLLDVKTTLQYGRQFVDSQLSGGETVLGIGGFFKDVIEHVDGMLSIGPFGCMPTRVTEAVLKRESTLANKQRLTGRQHPAFSHLEKLPFLSVESDGNPFPQVIETRIEAFALQVNRMAQIKREQRQQNSGRK